jgi:hypothetical protein
MPSLSKGPSTLRVGRFTETAQQWKLTRSLAVVVPMACLMAGIEAALVFALQAAKSKAIEWPLTLMAVLSAALLAAGVLTHYWDIYVHRTVRGISFIFVGIDAAGDLFSLISVLFEPSLDIKGMAIYGTELALWLGVFACGGYFNLVPWVQKRIRSQRAEQERNHVVVEDRDYQGIALRNLPSSTSVFRTPGSDGVSLRPRPPT